MADHGNKGVQGAIGAVGGVFAGARVSDRFGLNFIFAWILCSVVLYMAADFILGVLAGQPTGQHGSDRRRDQQAHEEIEILEEAGGEQAIESLVEIFKSSPDVTARKAARRALDRIHSRKDPPND